MLHSVLDESKIASHRRSSTSADRPDVDAERSYLVGRADAELKATFLASCVEAKYVHNVLTHAYIEECLGCSPNRTKACSGCKFGNVCERIAGSSSSVLPETQFTIDPLWSGSQWSAHADAEPL